MNATSTRKLNLAFSHADLRIAREEAKAKGLKLPKGMHVYADRSGTNPYFEVYANGTQGAIWSGKADNAYDARAKAIWHLIDEAARRN